ncbi:Arylsulfatase A [Lutibacter oricola]|uniref:Arylsulfatase A n=1 Tax=Lutibacter oricola TaxID=762486 RepID=A0A1H2WXM1_9FLAO|nr:sulfatase-like hydrolase/transferase [Lutibacter oricola]SDW85256.1 Arylsulfatase A [Lutibacter oricola]
MKIKFFFVVIMLTSIITNAQKKPNVVIFFADDISAREIPIYNSSVWSDPWRENTSDEKYRAKTPNLNKLANDGVWITTAWAATVCNPSRSMMLSGRYAYQTKWWNNKDKGYGPDENGKINTWPVYMSSPILLGHAAQKMGYGTFWAGKTQMAGSYEKHGFDEGCFTPGGLQDKDNPYADFKHVYKKVNGKRVLINVDTGKPADTYMQHSWYWYPHVKLMNHPSSPNDNYAWWPNTKESKKNFGLHTYGPDVELEFVFDFMERQQKADKPFFIYHTTHLGHDGFNWFNPDDESSWPGTPKVTWDGKKYTRQEPKITGDKGVYNTHNSITESGMHSHVNYIDYQVWLYQQKFKELGVEDNTIFIFAADNGTGGYGKNKGIQQRGCHIPLIIYAPGMKKQGEQDILVSIADVLPTFADMIGFEFPKDYKLDGKSLKPYLFGDKTEHRKWLYTYRGPEQLVRGTKVLKDGADKWWDLTNFPKDLTSYDTIKWGEASKEFKAEKKELIKVLPQYDFYYDAYNAPGVDKMPKKRPRYARKSKEDKVY